MCSLDGECPNDAQVVIPGPLKLEEVDEDILQDCPETPDSKCCPSSDEDAAEVVQEEPPHKQSRLSAGFGCQTKHSRSKPE